MTHYDQLTKYIDSKKWASDKAKVNILIGHYAQTLEYAEYAIALIKEALASDDKETILRGLDFLSVAIRVGTTDEEDSFPGIPED